MRLTPQRLLLLFLLFIQAITLLSQDFTPVVIQFSKKDYDASNQNWAVGQDKDGVMYFGNNQGLLEFDGSIWQIHKMPGNKIVRAIMVDGNRIYVGSFEEFGYFEKNDQGQLKYTSLSANLKNYKMQNDEIWTILNVNGTILFQSFTSYFSYKNNVISGTRCPYTFLFFNLFRGSIVTHTFQQGFGMYDLQTKRFIPLINLVLKSAIISTIPYDDDHSLLVTQSDGLFLFDGKTITPFVTNADDELKRSEVNRALLSPDGTIVIGTILNGVSAFNKQGQKLWTLNTSNVLQNNTVLGMYCDQNSNLWLALDKGIALLQLNSSIRYIRSFNPSVGAIYSLSYMAPSLYLGTNQGLYKATLTNDMKSIRNLQLEPKIKGQVWSVNNFDNQLICGNNGESFLISNDEARVISSVKGGICIKKGIIRGREVLVQGTYTQLCIYEKVNGKWQFSNVVDNFLNPIGYIEIDYTGVIWASHLHQGLYAIRLSSDLRKIEHIDTYNSLDGKHNYPINVFSINNRVVFTDNNAFYTYDDIRKKIIPYFELNQALGYFAHAYRVCPFHGDLYWFIRDGEAALLQVKTGDTHLLDVVHYSLFLNQTVDNYQNVVPVSDNACMFTLENGLALYRNADYSEKNKLTASLRIKNIQILDAESKESVYLNLNTSHLKIPFKRNNLIFTISYPQYNQLGNISFRYRLQGLDKVWSEPSGSTQRVYSYLPHGEYILHVQATTKSGIKLAETDFTFEVLPPFYLTLWAKIIYMILSVLFVVGIYYYVRHNFHLRKEKIHREQEQIRKKEIEKREQQIIALQKEKLESEVTVKSKKLAESTMTIIKKNEILVNIKEEVINTKKALGSQFPNKYYDKLIRLLDENLSSEDDWAIFQTNFDRIHENFFRNLHATYPELTPNDLKFCAYLRLNLSSKDIAHLMNISLKGVEVARSRIRKKIGIPSTKSLTEFMIEFK